MLNINMYPTNKVEHVTDFEEDDTFLDMLNDLRDVKIVDSCNTRVNQD